MSSRPGPRKASSHHTAAVLLLTVVLFGALGACTDILGITDHQVTSGSGAGGSGGGTGATGGAGGDDGKCTTDADCAGSAFGPVCDTPNQRCVECLPLPVENACSLGLFCDVTKVCVIGCGDDADCNPQGTGPLVCDPETHQCTGCSGSAPCPPGSKCELTTGVCVPGCDSTSDCPNADWSCCLKQCKNITKDLANCGACEEPCEPSQSTAWLCLDGGCVFQSCANGWADCDQNLGEGNGCEVDTQTDPLHCGDCDTACDLAHAIEGCSNATCTIAMCEEGFANCDDKVANGCEVNLATSLDHCGACDQGCESLANGIADCAEKKCVLVGCNTGFGDCDANPVNGCETDTKSSTDHCGACDAPCLLDHATSSCAGSKCAVVECDMGFADCNGDPTDGCEANLATDRLHCGVCDKGCEFPNAAGSCNDSACEIGACAEGFENCNGLAADGCEIDTNTDEDNCGGCGDECAAINGIPQCTAGACQFQCSAGFADCDMLPANGCEANTTNSVQHCGDCGAACPAVGGTPYCFNSTCGVSNCAPGTANCDGNPVNGCETNTNAPQNCGACGNNCSTTNGSASCNGTTCSITCDDDYGNCNNNVADGCEQHLNTNTHCTQCGVPCARPHAFTSCGTGSCQIVSCHDGWADCNNNPSDGCEINIDGDEGNCGGCGSLCAPPNATGVCMAGGCNIATCNGAFENCNGAVIDGCEVNTNTNEDNCGGCGDTCSLPNASSTCVAGACQVTSCTGNFANCDGQHPNGCEVNTQTNVDNCGACNNDCSDANGTPSCSGGQCGITCNPGFKNCNVSVQDGCEASLTTLQNCGNCGIICDLPNATESCASGTCQIVSCTSPFTNCDMNAANGCECQSGCSAGVCQGCGDGTCNSAGGENCVNCPADCSTCVCGNNNCEAPNETCSNCPNDCGGCCGNGFCQSQLGETCDTCSIDCGGPCCGNLLCQQMFGETCDTCPGDCGACAPTCNNGSCEAGETCMSCPGDCGMCCGNATCDAVFLENCDNCPGDCGMCCGNDICDFGFGETCSNCSADCGICMGVCGNTMCEPPMENCTSCPGDCGTCCGDGTCSPIMGEDCNTCVTDCPFCCGDGSCQQALGENCMSCFSDCSTCFCGDGVCLSPEDCAICPDDCGSCGSGGSGGSGGTTTSSGGSGGGGAGSGGAGGTPTSGGTMSDLCGPYPNVQCLGSPCGPLLGCCYPAAMMPMCSLGTTCMGAGDDFYACDDPSDCALGSVCCHTTGGGSVCTPAADCSAVDEIQLCRVPTPGVASCECGDVDECCGTGMKNAHYPTCQPVGTCK